MTIRAERFCVSTLEWELRLLCVVKFRFFPALNAVTILTFQTELAAMNILDRMAIIAGGREVFVNFTDMA